MCVCLVCGVGRHELGRGSSSCSGRERGRWRAEIRASTGCQPNTHDSVCAAPLRPLALMNLHSGSLHSSSLPSGTPTQAPCPQEPPLMLPTLKNPPLRNLPLKNLHSGSLPSRTLPSRTSTQEPSTQAPCPQEPPLKNPPPKNPPPLRPLALKNPPLKNPPLKNLHSRTLALKNLALKLLALRLLVFMRNGPADKPEAAYQIVPRGPPVFGYEQGLSRMSGGARPPAPPGPSLIPHASDLLIVPCYIAQANSSYERR